MLLLSHKIRRTLLGTFRIVLIDIQLHTTLPGHNNPVYAVCEDPHTGTFFTAGNDKGIVEWTLGSIKPKRLLRPVPASVYVLKLIGRALFAGLRNGQILKFDLETGKLAQIFGQAGTGVFDLLAIADKNELLSAGDNGMVYVWDAADTRLLHHWRVSDQKIRTMALDPTGKTLAVGSNDGTISIYDAADYSLQTNFIAHSMGVTSLSFSPNGQSLLSGSRDAHIRAWRSAAWDMLKDYAAHYFSIYRLAYHPVRSIFLSASRDKSFKLWNAADFRLLKNISLEKGHSSHRLSVNNAAWINGGNQIVTVSDDKMVLVWDLVQR